MNSEALLKLADLLESPVVQDENFNLDTWIDTSEGLFSGEWDMNTHLNYDESVDKFVAEMKWRFRRDKRIEVPHNCGMTCCALGWAGLDHWFITKGFKTTPEGAVKHKSAGTYGWDAAETFFKIDCTHCFYLFSDESYGKSVTKLDVANRIRDFVFTHTSTSKKRK